MGAGIAEGQPASIAWRASSAAGVIAGSKMRSVLELGGVKDVVSKNYGSNNPLNQVRATIEALLNLTNRKKNLEIRGRTT